MTHIVRLFPRRVVGRHQTPVLFLQGAPQLRAVGSSDATSYLDDGCSREQNAFVLALLFSGGETL